MPTETTRKTTTDVVQNDLQRGIVPTTIIGFIISIMVFWTALNMSLPWSLLLGYGTWIILLCCTSLFDWWFIIPKKNFGVVLGNQRIKETISDPEDPTIKKTVDSMREIDASAHGKHFYEYPVAYFDLLEDIILRGTLHVPDKNGAYWNVEWQIIGKWFSGYLVNAARIGKQGSLTFFQGHADGALTHKIGIHDGYKLQKDPNNSLNEWFGNFLGGPNKSDPLERKYALFTGTPQILSMIPDSAVEESSQEKIQAKNDIEAAKIYKADLHITMEKAMDLVFARNGKAKMFVGKGAGKIIADDRT